MRYVTFNGVRYLHQDDVAAFINTIADTEETDTKVRLREAAENLASGFSSLANTSR